MASFDDNDFDSDFSGEFDGELDTGPLVLDIANTHASNDALLEQKEVGRFFDQIRQATRPSDAGCKWLGNIPYDLGRTAIPLCKDISTDTHYQLHPCNPQLPLYRTDAKDPHFYIRQLIEKVAPDDYRSLALVVPFGRLFVNKPNPQGENGRLSKWTGFEVYFDLSLNIWFVFNQDSLASRDSCWFPVKCSLFGDNITPDATECLNGETCLFEHDEMLEAAPFQTAVAFTGRDSRDFMAIPFKSYQSWIRNSRNQSEVILRQVGRDYVDKNISSTLPIP
ncbi:hypothetical protein F4821DRAFT_239541 [Hypoxylon rubiginosum]|uniref:Uncharacterized protein n=1 Tax=Hypoxylon rubiginosum TaxID=110542 RepID=A0ACC0CZU0_9PEZI|nr:hypothetical protein F4821DRAFT_239541 [Hypoxylon rubiginosum]